MPDPNEYLAMLDRIEPNLVPIDTAAGYASTAVSMKRIADAVVEAHVQMMQATRDRDDHHEAAGHDDSFGRIATALEKIERVINPTHVLSIGAEAADALRQQMEAGLLTATGGPVLQPGSVDVDYAGILLKAAISGLISPLRARIAANVAMASDRDGTGTQTDADWAAGAAERDTEAPISGPGDPNWDAEYPGHMTLREIAALARTVASVMPPLGVASDDADLLLMVDFLRRNGFTSTSLRWLKELRVLNPRGVDDTGRRECSPDESPGIAFPALLQTGEIDSLRVIHQVATAACLWGIVGPDGNITKVHAIASGAPDACHVVHGILVRNHAFMQAPPLPQPAPTSSAPSESKLDDNLLTDDEFNLVRAFITAFHDLPGIGPQVYAHMMGAGYDDPRADIETFLGRW